MSRSYRKFPLVKSYKSCKFGKKQANKQIRSISVYEDIPQHRQYKKLYNSNMKEYCFYETEDDVIFDYESAQKTLANGARSYYYENSTLEEALADWKKFYKCK